MTAEASGSSTARFDSSALYEALDVRRRARGLTWRQLEQEIGVAASTIKNTANGGRMEADGVLSMLHWLGREPEAFLVGSAVELTHDAPNPPPTTDAEGEDAGRSRLDTAALYDALDSKRLDGALSWREVADQAGVRAGVFARGSPPSWDAVAFEALLGWLGLPAGLFELDPSDAPAAPPAEAFAGYARVDSHALHAALDRERQARGLTWEQVAGEVGPGLVSAGTLKRLAGAPSPRDRGRQGLGPRTGLHSFMAMVQWLRRPAADFVRRPSSHPNARGAERRE